MACQVQAQSCPPPAETATVAVPGHPFSALPDASGCWLFVSATTGAKGSVVVLRNHEGRFVVDHAVELQSGAFGEALSHDGGTLAVTGGTSTSLLDVARLEKGEGEPVIGVLPARGGAIYAAISPDDQLLFVSNETARQISVFALGLAGAQKGALIGQIPVAGAPWDWPSPRRVTGCMPRAKGGFPTCGPSASPS